MRGPILRWALGLGRPFSVREVAEALDLEPTLVRYNLNGLVEQVRARENTEGGLYKLLPEVERVVMASPPLPLTIQEAADTFAATQPAIRRMVGKVFRRTVSGKILYAP